MYRVDYWILCVYVCVYVYVCARVCVCSEAEVLGGLSLQYHHRGAEGFECHRGADRWGRRWQLHPVRVHECFSHLQQLRDPQAGPEADQDGGECKFYPSECWDSVISGAECIHLPLCAGVPDCRCCVRAGGGAGGPGAVCTQYQQWHHRHRAGLPGGPGGHGSRSGSAVWATGAGLFPLQLTCSSTKSCTSLTYLQCQHWFVSLIMRVVLNCVFKTLHLLLRYQTLRPG